MFVVMIINKKNRNQVFVQAGTRGRGGSRTFMGGGGGGGRAQKIYVRRTHITSAKPAKSFTVGVQDPLEGPGSSPGVFDVLSCYLSLSFEHFGTKCDKIRVIKI